MTTHHLLVVEDNETIGLALQKNLEHAKFDVRWVETAELAVQALKQKTADLVLCDIMLPGMDGLSLLQLIKKDYPGIPVIMLTAKGEEQDRVQGLEMGADDYVTKPFSVLEIIARINARLREKSAEPVMPETFAFGDVHVDLKRRTLNKGDNAYHLTTHEAGTLGHLIMHRGRDVSRDELLQEVWGYASSMSTRTVDNQILKLRKKIEDQPAQPRHILTIHGTGYRFEP
jgi:DNA-binding response OmpR family regulator